MTYSQQFLAQQKNLLIEEKERLESELNEIARKNPDLKDDYKATFPDYGRDREENAKEEEVYEARLSAESSLEVQLRDVRGALDKIASGSYGLCEQCGKEIVEDRLKAFPAARNCVNHA